VKAMILAAGLGTRLKPLTDSRPKALAEIAGRTLLEIAVERLRSAGVREIVVNVHHFAEMVIEYLRARENFGMRIEVSREEVLLDTGGGLKHAAWFFLEDSPIPTEPFILHNVDVISKIDLDQMIGFHRQTGALSTLAVQDRNTSRYLVFDKDLELCGRHFVKEQRTEWARPCSDARNLAFAGIHVVSPRLFSMLTEEGAFSIVDAYLRLAAKGERVLAFRADGAYWKDLGRPESLLEAEADMRSNRVC